MAGAGRAFSRLAEEGDEANVETLYNLKGATWGGLGLGLSVGTTNAAFGRAGSICGEGGGFGRAGSVMGGADYGSAGGPSAKSLSDLAEQHAAAWGGGTENLPDIPEDPNEETTEGSPKRALARTDGGMHATMVDVAWGADETKKELETKAKTKEPKGRTDSKNAGRADSTDKGRADSANKGRAGSSNAGRADSRHSSSTKEVESRAGSSGGFNAQVFGADFGAAGGESKAGGRTGSVTGGKASGAEEKQAVKEAAKEAKKAKKRMEKERQAQLAKATGGGFGDDFKK